MQSSRKSCPEAVGREFAGITADLAAFRIQFVKAGVSLADKSLERLLNR
jgi:hypothetical protein